MPLAVISSPDVATTAAAVARVERAFRHVGYGASLATEIHDTVTVLRFPRECQPARQPDVVSGGVLHTFGFFVADVSATRLFDGLVAGTSAFEQVAATLDGPFLLAAVRPSSASFATDRMGACHAFEARIGDAHVVASAALPLACASGAELDPVSVREFLAIGTVFGDRTLFRGVRKLKAASVYTLRDGRLTEDGAWWNLRSILWDRISDGTPERLADAIVRTMSRIGSVVHEPVLDLTGGFDSRGLLAGALAAGLDIKTVTSGDESSRDILVASHIAGVLGIPHMTAFTAGEGSTYTEKNLARALRLSDGEIDVFLGAPVAATQARSALNGTASIQGSCGEFSRGYWWDLVAGGVRGRAPLDARHVARQRFALDDSADAYLAEKEGSLVDHFAREVETVLADVRDLPTVSQADAVYVRMRMQHWGGRFLSATLRQIDSIGPYAFLDPMREAFSAPPGVRRGNRMPRHVIGRLNPKLAKLPTESGAPACPITPLTVHRFLPLLGDFGKRALARVARSVGRPSAPSAHPIPALRALQRDDVRERLSIAALSRLGVFDKGRLGPWLVDALDPARPKVRILARLLTLQMADDSVRSLSNG